MSRKQRDIRGIKKLRRELRCLKRRWKLANSRKDNVQKLGYEELRNQQRENLKNLQRAERKEREGKQRSIKEGGCLEILADLTRLF